MTFKTLPYQTILEEIGHVADSLRYNCYVVGGFVRDLLLNRDNDDIDVVVVGKGVEMAKAYVNYLRDNGQKAKYSLFENFGTAQVRAHDMEIEFVGARKESYERGSRKPIVEEGTLKDDQLRRDFTINAMAICLNKKHFGKLVDPFNGVDDLKRGIIRTPVNPDITFSDDPLRQLRAVRFAAKLNFDIDRDTFEVGDIIKINKMLFDGNYIITSVKEKNTKNVSEYIATCRNINVEDNYINLFRGKTRQENSDRTYQTYITHYTQDGIKETHEVVK
jgi:tRNA nucleotidyltransferase/poly(A) polymerase